MKLYIEGFRGPWGWVDDFEKTYSEHEIVSVEDAEIIYQCDPTNWQANEQYLGKKYIIANVLDFAEWVGGNPEVDEYVNKFVCKADQVTGISDKVIGQLMDRGCVANMFYYPSQVYMYDISTTIGIKKKNRAITFCRLGDPGKRVEYAVEQFLLSGVHEEFGWEYWLMGPEAPNFIIPHPSIKYMRYLDREMLMNVIASSRLTIMPSLGEGLGLPAIESLLLKTHVMCRVIEPMKSILGEQLMAFNEDRWPLAEGIHVIAEQPDIPIRDSSHLLPWARENAYMRFNHLIKEAGKQI